MNSSSCSSCSSAIALLVSDFWRARLHRILSAENVRCRQGRCRLELCLLQCIWDAIIINEACCWLEAWRKWCDMPWATYKLHFMTVGSGMQWRIVVFHSRCAAFHAALCFCCVEAEMKCYTHDVCCGAYFVLSFAISSNCISFRVLRCFVRPLVQLRFVSFRVDASWQRTNKPQLLSAFDWSYE